jgi:hypothetical protein
LACQSVGPVRALDLSERWTVGALASQSVGPVGALDCWSVGLSERWSVGVLDCGSVGAVEYRPEEVNGSKGLGRIAQEPVGL